MHRGAGRQPPFPPQPLQPVDRIKGPVMTSTRRPPEPASSTNLAVALRGAEAERPRVIASGRGAVAEQILEIAFANDVKVRSDAELAEILSAVEVDSEIPIAALATVAEILSYVYRAEHGSARDRGQANRASGAAEDQQHGDS